MRYYDQHLHTNYSYDSREQLKNYLALANDFLVTTEHLDLRNIRVGYDCLFDYPAYRQELKELSAISQVQLLAGIEIGYLKSIQSRNLDFLANKEFDIKLLSFHQTEEYSFLDPIVLKKDPKALLIEYLELMWAGIQDFHAVNVLAHFDFGIRLVSISEADFIKLATPYLVDIFKLAIKKGIALELNTRSMYDYDKLALYHYAIDIYQELGGEMFVVSSDAHSTSYYRYCFEEAFQVLKQHKIKYLTVFQQGQPQKIAI